MKSGRPHQTDGQPRPDKPEVTLAPAARDRDLANAARFGVRLAATRDPSSWQLVRAVAGLELWAPTDEGGYRVQVDVSTGPLARRIRTARRTDPLPRALGLQRRESPPTVVDATAGLGRDALVLAQLGCTVTAIECVPAFAMLLQNAVDDAGEERLTVVCTDAVAWLRALPEAAAPDVVYLDPMFEEAGRSQVKKEMQACRALAATGDDLTELLAAARAVARERVVVKRHPHHQALDPNVSHAVTGERVRFDVYLRG